VAARLPSATISISDDIYKKVRGLEITRRNRHSTAPS
jgi:hypothetical protein